MFYLKSLNNLKSSHANLTCKYSNNDAIINLTCNYSNNDVIINLTCKYSNNDAIVNLTCKYLNNDDILSILHVSALTLMLCKYKTTETNVDKCAHATEHTIHGMYNIKLIPNTCVASQSLKIKRLIG